jgi:hypothetical protein
MPAIRLRCPLAALAPPPVRLYSSGGGPGGNGRFNRLQRCAATGYVCAALALPFVPPYLATQRTKRDGSWTTRSVSPLPFLFTSCRGTGLANVGRNRPPLKYTYRPIF